MVSRYGGLVVESQFGGVPVDQAPRDINSPLQFGQKFAQGATFGFGDEISAGMAASLAALGGYDFDDAYQFSLDKIRADEKAFEEESPILAGGAELTGAVGTGLALGGRILAKALPQTASTLAKYGTIGAVGAGEGGLYSAGTAEEDRGMAALQGGATGALLAPLGAKLGDLLIRGGKGALSFAGRKLMDTPRSEAIRALRRAAEAEGIDAEDAIKLLDEMGPEATLADLGENFRFLARAAVDSPGSFKPTARDVMNLRQAGQQDRILEAAEVVSGQKAGNFSGARNALIKFREDKARPLYEEAFEEGIEPTDTLIALMERPSLKASLKKAERIAADAGEWTGEMNLLQRLHYAKMDLDDKIGAAIRSGSGNRARTLTTLKNELLEEIDELNPAYREARDLFAGSKTVERSMDTGRKIFNESVEDLEDAVANMSRSEEEFFRLGAVRAIKDRLDNIGESHDAVKRLLNTRAMRDKLALVFDDPDDFIQRLQNEVEFSRTRSVLTGGSPTSERLAGRETLLSNIQPELLQGLSTGDTLTAGPALLKIFAKHEVSPELVEELAGMMLERGQSAEQVRKLLSSPAVRVALGEAYERNVLPALGSAVVPAAQSQ